jgi:hypothetical protein
MSYGNYETALFKNQKIVYKDEWGYEDIKCFDTFDDLYKEILFICDKIHS